MNSASGAAAVDPTQQPQPRLSAADRPQVNNEAGEAELGWMNYMGQVMWPYAREAIRVKAKSEMLERLQMEVARHPEITLSELSIEYDPGSVPPTIKRVRTYQKTQQEFHGLQVDLEIDWEAKEFLVKPRFKGSGPAGVPIDSWNVAITGFALKGTASVVLAPLVKAEPCFAAQQFFFFDPPHMKLTISGLKALGVLGKLISSIIKKTTLNVMAETFVLPHRMLVKTRKDIPLEMLIKVKSPLPLGCLAVEVIEARNLPASDVSITGKQSSDPFVEVSIGDAKIRTSTVSSSLNPKWQDGVDYLLVYNIEQKVQIAVFDDDILTEDDLMGYLPGYNVLYLCQDLEDKPDGEWLKLRHPTDPSKTAGEIRLRVRYLQVAKLGPLSTEGPPPSPRVASNERTLYTGSIPRNVPAPVSDGSNAKLVTVKLLGMEGETAKSFTGARAIVDFIPAQPGDGDAPSTTNPGLFSRGSRAFWSSMETLGRQTQKLKATTGLGFGHREHGVPTSSRSCKAMLWGESVSNRHGASSGFSPIVVRAIEQLRHREGWDFDRIAAMFGIDEEAATVAAALRANFEVVWHQAFHYLQRQDVPTFTGKVRIAVRVPTAGLDKTSAIANGLVAKDGLLGVVQLDLSSAPIADDKPWQRRVRARLRRPNAGFPAEKETLKGEGQCDQGLGDAVPGVLIEFLIEVRGLAPDESVKHLEEGQNPGSREDLEQLFHFARMGSLEVLSL